MNITQKEGDRFFMNSKLIFKIEKPFTDPNEKYTVTNSKETNCFKLHNLESGKTYIVNPFQKICDCPDFQYRADGGSCKHIDFLRDNKNIKPFIKEYQEKKQNTRVRHAENINVPEVVERDNMPYSLMERKDEDQILSEIKGNVLQEFVYSFPQGNRKITGLSYAGVKQIALEMGSLHVCEPILLENDGNWIAKVKAIDVHRNLEMWGVSSQPKKMTYKNGVEVDDDFCIQKAVSKAERNALRKLMPERIIIEMVKEWQQKNNGGRSK